MIGSTISHYKILEKLGEGGMGVVYKAQDLKLDRTVALKFLPERVSASSDELNRFIQEAKAAAALNHPNICTIYGIEEWDSKNYIVMEYVDGHTLEETKSSLSQKQAIEIGIQIAEGLAAAHEKGIVHRDVKPENIMIHKDRRVQIMDFGLAKLKGASRLTKEGSTVGTASYMSPEQIQGQETDHRTDIFSLGVVLYELLAGQSPFKGVHDTAIAYEIVNVDPEPLAAVKPEIDPSLDAIVLDCLEKDPKERCQSAAEVARDLRRFKRETSRQQRSRITAARQVYGASSSAPQGAALASMDGTAQQSWRLALPRREFFAWGIATMFLIGMVVFALPSFRKTEVLQVRAFIPPPFRAKFDTDAGGHIALSPDGKFIAFVTLDSAGKSNLWVRRLNALAGELLKETEDAAYPFWSPDSRFIGFFANGKLKRIEATGGPSRTICDASSGRGGSWNHDGIIVFAPERRGPLARVSAEGGSKSAVTKLDSSRHEVSHRWPCFLPDGRHFLFITNTSPAKSAESDSVCVGSLDAREIKVLFHGTSNLIYVSDCLVFAQGNTLMAQPFDPKTLEMKTEAFPFIENVKYDEYRSKAIFTISDNGALAYQTEIPPTHSQLIWYDRTGRKLESSSDPDFYGASLALSPNGKSLAYELSGGKARNIWISDLVRHSQTRLTFGSVLDDSPVWSPDGSRIAFDSNRGGSWDIFEKSSDGSGEEKLLAKPDAIDVIVNDWSTDGKYLVYSNRKPKTGWDLWILPMFGDRKPFQFLETEFREEQAKISPNGQWLAYVSDESGRREVFVRPFPKGTGKWQVSTSGGCQPIWRRDGRELFYLNLDKMMVSVPINSSASTFKAGIPKLLFQAPVPELGLAARDYYAISTDGQRFLLNTVIEAVELPITLVVNWDAELRKK